LTRVNFITQDKMLWYNYVYENNVYKQMRHSIIVEREGAWEAGWWRERVALIKSWITQDRKDVLEAWLPNQAENVSWYYQIREYTKEIFSYLAILVWWQYVIIWLQTS